MDVAYGDGSRERVRLIGVNTPERGECYSTEATEYTRRRVLGRRVDLQLDIEPFDIFDRLLAYVWIGDSMLNLELVEEGYARVDTRGRNVRYADWFREGFRFAQGDGLGRWSACGQ